MLIICEDVDSEALSHLVINKLRGGLKICAVKAPAFGDNRKAIMNDIATITGGTVVSEELGLTLEKAEMSVLGRCKNIILTKDDTIIMNGYGDKSLIEDRV